MAGVFAEIFFCRWRSRASPIVILPRRGSALTASVTLYVPDLSETPVRESAQDQSVSVLVILKAARPTRRIRSRMAPSFNG
jgi:hypothetical protein